MKNLYKFGALCFALMGIFMGQSQAQLNLTWESQGPDNLGGRTRSMAFSADGSVVFAGSTGGGLWQSGNLGESWTKVTGFNDNQVVSSIAVSGSKIYVGTGELVFYSRLTNPQSAQSLKTAYLGYSGVMGKGIYVSQDGGATFSNANATWPHGASPEFNTAWTSVQKISANPAGPRVFAATLSGLYFSDDDFASIAQPTGDPDLASATFVDVAWMADGMTVLAATATKLFVSTDGGNSFSVVSNSAITGNAIDELGGTRIVIAPSPTDPNIVYVSGTFPLSNNVKGGRITGVFRSSDKGTTWTRIAPAETYQDEANMGWFAPLSIASNKVRGQGTYAFMLAVNPADPNVVYLGGQQFWVYESALGWQIAGFPTAGTFNTNYVPANIHCMIFHPTNPAVLFIGTDKEIIRSLNNGGTTLPKTKGYKAALLYGVAAAPDGSIVAGSHTHGIIHRNMPLTGESQSFNIGGVGVGGKVAASIVPAKNDYQNRRFDDFLGSFPQGLVNRSTTKGSSYELFYALPEVPNPFGPTAGDTVIDRPFQIPPGSTAQSNALGRPNDYGAYITTFTLDEVLEYGSPQSGERNSSFAYVATNRYIWTVRNPFATPSNTNNELPTWTRISPPLLTQGGAGTEIGADPEKNPLNGISAMGVSNDVNHTLFVGTTNGKLFRILRPHEPLLMDTSTMFAEITPSNFPTRWMTSIAVDPSDPNNVVVTFGGYATGDSRVFRSNDALSASPTFVDIQGNLPSIPVYACAYNPNSSGAGFILGTEWGVFTTTDNIHATTSPNWVETNTGDLNRVPVFDVKSKRFDPFYGHDATLYIATYGMGAFRSTGLVSVDKGIEADPYQVKVYPNPLSGKGTLEYSLPAGADVRIEVYGITGNLIQVLENGKNFGGHYVKELDATNLNTGVYLVKFNIQESGKTWTKTVKTSVIK